MPPLSFSVCLLFEFSYEYEIVLLSKIVVVWLNYVDNNIAESWMSGRDISLYVK